MTRDSLNGNSLVPVKSVYVGMYTSNAHSPAKLALVSLSQHRRRTLGACNGFIGHREPRCLWFKYDKVHSSPFVAGA